MLVTADARNPLETRTDLLVVPVPALDGPQSRLPSRLALLDRALDGRVRNIVESGDFRGKKQQRALLYPNGEVPAKRVLLVGLGPEGGVDAEVLRSVAGDAVKEAMSRHAAKVTVAVPGFRRMKPPGVGQALAEGAVLGGYRFDEYKNPGEEPPGQVAAFQLSFERAPDARAARGGARKGSILAESQNVARDLSNQPGNALPPAGLAREAQKVAREVGLRAKVLGPADLKKQKMGAILAVGGGSHNSPRMIALEHKPKRATRKGETICFVGKGVTFDSGGISIKPAAAMDEMKHDMSGAATVVGALRACALLNVPHHVVGIIGAAENLPSATAYRPGDVVTAASGQTIEVLNTDAEGRVVLADALHYARTQYSPKVIIDFATLTGACVVALGRWASGLFGNNDKLVEAVRRAGAESAEIAWPLPLFDGHKRAVKSEVADLKNTGAGREAGSSTAAAFLAAFAGDVPWVHLDIAGTAWTSRPSSYQPRGATGVGVRLLLQLLDSWKSVRL